MLLLPGKIRSEPVLNRPTSAVGLDGSQRLRTMLYYNDYILEQLPYFIIFVILIINTYVMICIYV